MGNNKMGHHISAQFDKELADIRGNVLAMGGMVERQTKQAIAALVTGDSGLADQVIQQDTQVDALEMAIDQECSAIIALRQPAAFDLRMLIGVIKIIRELERTGDKAVRVARIAIQMAAADAQGQQYELEHMAEVIQQMLNGALDAFARLDVSNVASITGRDANVDREYENILRCLITRMMEDPRAITHALNVVWAARALERIGDYACNICEHLVYIVNGLDVRHLSQEQLEQIIPAAASRQSQ